MNEKQQDNNSMKTNNQQINNDKNITTNKSSKDNIKEKIKKFELFVCLKECFFSLRLKWNYYLSKCLLLTQFLLFSIPIVLFSFSSIFLIHYFGFERIYKFDFSFGVENEYLKYLITEIDDINVELGSNEIKSQFEDIDNLYFYDIYFQELISMGLLSEDPSNKIFPSISENSETSYKSYNELNQANNINNIYTIPSKDTKKYIDERKDNLAEIGKIYYNFLPLLTYEAVTKNTFINDTYLIAYEFDPDTKEIKDDYLYFAFPGKSNELSKAFNYFYPTNSFISPQVSKTKMEHGEKYNDSFYKENWFIQQDYNFRISADDDNQCDIVFTNLNYNHYGKLNKSNIVSLQSYYHVNDDVDEKSYIINIIYYIKQKELNEEHLEFSTFLLFNESFDSSEVEKYSDNETFLISKQNIAELTLSSKMTHYFHFGMYDNNYNFFKDGVSFDTIDLENFGEPLEFYNSIEKFNIDLRYFSSLYLYSSLFRKLSYEQIKEESKDLNEVKFINENDIVQEICEEIDLTTYLEYLEEQDIDCFDNNNLLYYSETTVQKDAYHFNYNTMPYCICLPLYCIKNLESENFNVENIELVEEIKLPDKCRNYFLNYLNGIEEDFKDHPIEYDTILEYNFGLNNIKYINKALKDNIEDEFYIYKSFKFPQVPKIIFLIVTLIDNTPLKNLLSELITKLDEMKTYYLIIVLSGMFFSGLIGNIVFFRNILKISRVIFDYQKMHEKYLNKLESSSEKEEKENNKNMGDNFNSGNNFEKQNDLDNLGYIKNDKNKINDKIYDYILYSTNENSLLNELLMLYTKYYNITKEELIKKNHESKRMLFRNNKRNQMKENELFKLLRIISFYIPKFKLNVSMDYNFYANTKLNINYLKFTSKVQHQNQQINILTQSVLYELLSTEKIDCDGLITNFRFKYITNINFNPKKENRSIKNSMFAYIEKTGNYEQFIEDNIDNEFLKDDIKILWKEKNKILEDFENNFENDDYLKKEKLNSTFDSFLINAYYKYLRKIILFNSLQFEEKFD